MDGMQWMASAMHAARTQLETAAHNLANADSRGFQRVRTTLALGDRGLVERTGIAPEQGAVRATGRPFDLALIGPGAFRVAGGATRDGAFVRDRDGTLSDTRGRPLLGRHGALHVSAAPEIATDGSIREHGRLVDRIALPPGTSVRSGALESSAVDPIAETLAILGAQRAFETAEKTFGAIDETRQKAVDDVGRLK